MARVLVMDDSTDLHEGVSDRAHVRLVEELRPEHLDEFHSSQQFLDRLESAVREPPRALARR